MQHLKVSFIDEGEKPWKVLIAQLKGKVDIILGLKSFKTSLK